MDLKEARQELKLTQPEIAEALEISLSAWRNYESGKRSAPREALIKLEDMIRDRRDRENVTGAEDIKIYLLDALREKGADKPVFIDLVNRYISLWETSIELEKDIKRRGVSVETAQGYKKNESVALVVNVNKQMLLILDKLGLNANALKQEDGTDV